MSQQPPQTTPAQPPPASMPPPGPPAGGQFFKAGKQKTIAIAVGAVALLGGGGVLAGTMLGGGDDDKGVAGAQAPAPQLSPVPVAAPTAAPTSAPTSAPTAAPTEAPPPTGGGFEMGAITTVPLPAPWEVLGASDDQSVAEFGDGANNYVYAETGTANPADDASAALGQAMGNLLAEGYSQVETTAPAPLQPFGSIVSLAAANYSGLWGDAQGASEVAGAVFLGIRQDGSYLLMLAEATPPEVFDQQIWAPLVDGAFGTFGGA